MNQTEMTERNRIAWMADSYQAWVNRYGVPEKAAADIASEPRRALRRVLEFIGDPEGLKVANPLGSQGRVATALALLGADVTVFDVSESNAKFAQELAASADVAIEYVVGDFQLTADGYPKRFDVAVMELGIVHYFVDISSFVKSVRTLLRPAGRLVLNEFHPLLKKAIDIDTGKLTVKGDYFATDFEEAPTPYEIFTTTEVPECLIRRWNLGEIVTAFALGGFRVEQLIEYPSWDFAQLPGTFTLVATAA